jgi:hypothetical protein
VGRISIDSACFDIIERAEPASLGSRGHGTINQLWCSGRYARTKRQLNSRELIRYGLANTGP